MLKITVSIVFLSFCFFGVIWASYREEVNIETNSDDPFITKMYAKEIEDGDNAELPLQRVRHKHHKGKKKHFPAILNKGFYGGHHRGYHGGFIHPHHITHNVPIGLPINDGLEVPHVHGYPYHVNHIPHHHHVRIGHGPELPIVHPPIHHHGLHHAHFPGYMPLPYTLPMCVIEKDDDKKDDKKKEEEKKKEKDKKSKRQLIPCHFYGPPGAGWGGFTPGWMGSGWGSPSWY